MPDPEPTRDPAREEGARAAAEDVRPEDVGAEDEDFVAQEEERAGAQAAAIGGSPSSASPDEQDEAWRPLEEAGEGEAEGFELAEQELIENASHGDQHAARRVIEDAPEEPEDARRGAGGEADSERSSERDADW